MNRIIFIISIILFPLVKGHSQISNATELSNFAKYKYDIKNKNLIENKWSLIKSDNNIEDNRGVIISKSMYSKNYDNKNESRLLIEKKIYPDNKSVILLWTTLIIYNGSHFDKLIDGLEKLGYKFKPLTKGKLFAGSLEEKFLITSEIKNIEDDSSKWYYEIKFVYNPN
ncbi:hypothetical protein [Flavobacterium gilvum]|uniref:Uncharacterized protein n=1 Tax=Flavobacterium gilvum TaxID=1492737 RepID=A0AAC9I8T9_9FLAO|nr:hypothetical protein [Flavobacterium gilvum]AOW10352.1 hypothetical protein EM308_13035 [Flavobacterium gilvum]KFC59752.1 hypothetical protein FEM08_14200 [Flavobacterium gilvum]